MALKLIDLGLKYSFRPILYIYYLLFLNIAIPLSLSAEEQRNLLLSAGRDQMVIESDRQSTDSNGDVFTAFGNVSITYSEKGIFATSQQVQYLRKERVIVLTGNVDLVRQGKESLNCERIVYFIDEDRLIADSSSGNQVLLKFNLDSESSNSEASSL